MYGRRLLKDKNTNMSHNVKAQHIADIHIVIMSAIFHGE